MNLSLVSERYAKALFQLALEQKAEEAVYADSRLIAKTCAESRELRLLVASPIINSGKKAVILKELFDGKVHPLTMNYLMIMVRKNREAFIQAIAKQLEAIYQEFRNILSVRFKSPVIPDEAIRREVIALVEKFTSATVELQPEIDESIIGGFVLNWKDLQYDASIRREIERMRIAIAKVNLYKKSY